MAYVLEYLRRMKSRQVVRPWAICAPVVLLLIALPLLRPLRWPGDASENELSRLATVQALVEHDSLAINDTEFFITLRHPDPADDNDDEDAAQPAGGVQVVSVPAPWQPGDAVPGTIVVGGKYYSDKPPVMGYLLSWIYALIYKMGWSFQHNPAGVTYVLTMLGATIPAAAGAGLIYRMGRMFELKRPVRTGLALIVGLSSGLVSYSTVLNSHAPAAALVLMACACLWHVTNSKHPAQTGAWLMTCGLCAALAAVIDLSAGIFAVLLVFVVLAFQWNWGLRVGGAILYLIGCTPPLLLHAVLTVPVTGDLRPGFLHPELSGDKHAIAAVVNDEFDDVAKPSPWKVAMYRGIDRTFAALVGSKGLLAHFPIAIIGVLGISLVLRRHWPTSTKVMAAVTGVGAVVIVVMYILPRADWTQAMFGPRWFVVFLPLLVFWAGAWLRKPHGWAMWTVAGVLLVFSVSVSVVGACAPFVKATGGQYTVVAAVKKMTAGEKAKKRHRAGGAVAAR
jgi:hypothetical protein